MAIWPFGRARRRTKPDGPQPAASGTKAARPQSRQAAANANAPSHRVGRKLSKRNSHRRRPSSRQAALERAEKDLLSPLAPIAPMSPLGSGVFDRPPAMGSREDITALPVSRELRTSPHLRPAALDHADIPYNFRLHSSHSNIPPPRHGKLQRNPSRNKRAAVDSPLPRRTSTKKRKDDHIREEEIRAMSAPIPIPKPNITSGILRRESKKMRGGMNRHFERPLSNVSLPPEDSIHSSMSGHSESRNYRVTMMDIVAARPTLRLSLNTPYVSTGMSQNTWTAPSRADSRRERRPAPPREVLKESPTVDALADDLDASELREIMERDKRRRERRRKAEAEKLQRKLERKAEKQRIKELKEQERARTNAAPPVPDDTEVRDSVGLGIQSRPRRETESSIQDATLDKSRTKDTTESKHSDTYMRYSSQEEIPRMPLLSSHGDPESRAETPFEMQLDDEPAVEVQQPTKYTTRDMSPPASPLRLESGAGTISASETLSQPSSLPQSYTTYGSTPPPSAPRRGSETKRGMFSSLFRRDPSRRKPSVAVGKITPSPERSFTNVSREYMAQQPPPAHLYKPPSRSESRSRTPVVRTQSKFREDLPELPLSPPDSRVQSPEATVAGGKAIAARRGYPGPHSIQTEGSESRRLSSPFEDPAKFRTDSPVSGGGSNLMSKSLASIDSEGSWLSGKPMNRLSSKSRIRHQSGTSSIARATDDASTSHEELGIHDDEYFRRFTPQPAEVQRSSNLSNALARKASSNAMAPGSAGSDTEEELQSSPTQPQRTEGETVVHIGPNRHPTVHHRDIHVKSSEGLLNQFIESGEDLTITPGSPNSNAPESLAEEEDSPIEDPDTPQPSLERATSVNFGSGHVRQLSAGSAKLLEIPKKNFQADHGSARASRSITPEAPEYVKL